jgi:glucan endo-1,3-alpha-glucosidase
MPDFVEIITWNDYGESSYICDTNPAHIVQGAEKYITGYDHSGFRAILPYFIQAYKSGNPNMPLNHEDRVVAWYRTTPVRAGSDAGTVWGQGGSESAAKGARDVISIIMMTNGSKVVTVDIGGRGAAMIDTPSGHPIFYLEIPVARRVGPVTIGINGKSKTGPAITNECPPCGHVSSDSPC